MTTVTPRFFAWISLFFMIGGTGAANASLITVGLADYSGPNNQSATLSNPVQHDLSAFEYDLQGASILSATLSGTWGNPGSIGTAHNQIFADNLLAADSRYYSPNPFYNTVDWRLDFTDFVLLADGFLKLTVLQNSCCYLQLSNMVLNIETDGKMTPMAIPEPESVLLLMTGFLGLCLRWNFGRQNRLSGEKRDISQSTPLTA